MDGFMTELNRGIEADPDENVFLSIWNEYERVIVQSLITSFGLDFLVQDQYGGDVDTIHNVRKVGKDDNMSYKNEKNKTDYDSRGAYNSTTYHQDSKYIALNRKIKEQKKEGKLVDAYTGKTIAPNEKADQDHVISAKKIHDDPGRILAGLKGEDLANCEENLKPTDRTINRSMQDKDIEEYLKKWEEERPERQRKIKELQSKRKLSDQERKELEKLEKIDGIDPAKMRAENKKARIAYEKKIAKEYYISPQFLKDTAMAAGKRGTEMGMRQAVGFVFVEIWMAAKEELQKMPSNNDLRVIIETTGNGVKKGVERAKTKYKEILEKFGEGFTAGILASVTTTITNIFFTTAKNIVKCIRQIYASIVEAGKVLLFNPDNLIFGERIKTAAIIMATGASVLVGTSVGELLAKTPIVAIPGLGHFIQPFVSTLVSGLLSCTFLVFLDRSKFMNMIIDTLNRIPSLANDYKVTADIMEKIAAGYEKIDIEKFREETNRYGKIAERMCNAKTEDEMNSILLSAYKTFNIKIPWEGDFDSFMGNRTNQLVFE